MSAVAQAVRHGRQQVIRNHARFLQLSLWNRRHDLWERDVPAEPIDVLQPGVALELQGFSVESRSSLGEEWDRGLRSEVAAVVDRERRKVYMSSRYPLVVQNFTAAHELGHVILHPHIDVKHREFPKDGPSSQRDWEEREADWFASEFLMPEKQVRLEFAKRFGRIPFHLNEDTAYALCGSSIDKVLRQCRCPRDISRLLAEATMFNGVPMASLASRFAVSSKAMAIRLNELELIA